MRYGGDALLLDKEIDIYLVQKPLYFFDKNIKLTVDTLQDGKVYFLDIWIVKDKTNFNQSFNMNHFYFL